LPTLGSRHDAVVVHLATLTLRVPAEGAGRTCDRDLLDHTDLRSSLVDHGVPHDDL